MSAQSRTPGDEHPSGLFRPSVLTVAVALVYGLGLLLFNVHLSRFGIQHFEFLRPRLVFTGIGYLIFIAIPVGLALLVLNFRQVVNRWIALTLFFVYVILVPLASSYFIDYLYPRPANNFMAFGSFIAHFWGLYSDWEILIGTSLLVVGMLLYFAPAGTWREWLLTDIELAPIPRAEGATRRIIPKLLIGIGFLALLVPYGRRILPNIDQAVGGGQPQAVVLTRNTSDVTSSADDSSNQGSYTQRCKGLLLTRSDDFLYLASRNYSRYRVLETIGSVAVPRSSIVEIRFLPVDVVFRREPQGSGGPIFEIPMYEEDSVTVNTIEEALSGVDC